MGRKGSLNRLSFDCLIYNVFPFINPVDLFGTIQTLNSLFHECVWKYFRKSKILKENIFIPQTDQKILDYVKSSPWFGSYIRQYNDYDWMYMYDRNNYFFSGSATQYEDMKSHFSGLFNYDLQLENQKVCPKSFFLFLCKIGAVDLSRCFLIIIKHFILKYLELNKREYDMNFRRWPGLYFGNFKRVDDYKEKIAEDELEIIDFLYEFAAFSKKNTRIESEDLPIEKSFFHFAFVNTERYLLQFILEHPNIFRIPTPKESKGLYFRESIHWLRSNSQILETYVLFYPFLEVSQSMFEKLVMLESNENSISLLLSFFQVFEMFSTPEDYLYLKDQQILELFVQSQYIQSYGLLEVHEKKISAVVKFVKRYGLIIITEDDDEKKMLNDLCRRYNDDYIHVTTEEYLDGREEVMVNLRSMLMAIRKKEFDACVLYREDDMDDLEILFEDGEYYTKKAFRGKKNY